MSISHNFNVNDTYKYCDSSTKDLMTSSFQKMGIDVSQNPKSEEKLERRNLIILELGCKNKNIQRRLKS